MKKNNDLGKYISDKLQDVNHFPNDLIWGKIDIELNKKKKRKLIYTCFLLIIISFSIGFSVLKLNFYNTIYLNNDAHENLNINRNKKSSNLFINEKTDKSNSIKKEEPASRNNIKNKVNYKSISLDTDVINIYENSKAQKTFNNKIKLTNNKISVENKKYQLKNNSLKIIKNSQKTTSSNNGNDEKTIVSNLNKISNTKIVLNDNLYLEEQNSTSKTEKFKNKISQKRKQIGVIDSIVADSAIAVLEKLKKEDIDVEKTIKKEIVKEPITQIVSVFYGPTLISSFSKGSSINNSMKNLKKSINISSTYGVFYRVMYKEMGLRIGLANTNLSNSTIIPKRNNEFITNYSNIELNSNNTPQIINSKFETNNSIKLIQNLSYYEIPLELYKPLLKNESNYGVDLFIGITPQISAKNNLEIESSNGINYEIGKASNIRKINIGFQFGLGINYKLTKELQIDINPIFKYQVAPYENNNNINPFYIAIQSGLSYKF